MDEEPASIIFSPPLYIQRYQIVFNEIHKVCLEIANASSPNIPEIKIADVGCNDASFFKYIKNGFEITDLPWNTHYYGVDCDTATLQDGISRVTPLTTDSLVSRSGSLTVSLYEGDILQPGPEIQGVDIVVMIEVIEHIPLQGVNYRLAHSLFHELQPSAVIMTTPNSEFNVMFGTMKFGDFRHEDHKFEWTRDEFQSWCWNAISDTKYSVTFSGIGGHKQAPPDIGCCSQMAVFKREESQSGMSSTLLNGSFNLIYQHEYPFRPHLTAKESAAIKLRDHLSRITCKFEKGLLPLLYASDSEDKEEEENSAFYIGDKCWKFGDVLCLNSENLLTISVAYLNDFVSNYGSMEETFVQFVIADLPDYSFNSDHSKIIFRPPLSDSIEEEDLSALCTPHIVSAPVTEYSDEDGW